jgi:8-oxo-dGTP pyrophosphatase MutT (NUDIX family)
MGGVSRKVICANCGSKGHVFRHCPDPIVSCGIICRRVSCGVTQYLIVQRKDSYSFVEFMRGKYDPCDRGYLADIFCGMTSDERLAVSRERFDALWKTLWNGFSKARFRPDYEDASRKFALLKSGVLGHDVESLLRDSEGRGRDEPEWGFPKGRRNSSSETVTECAVREMIEETGIEKSNLVLDDGGDCFEETFLGNNGIWYRHVYRAATLVDPHAPLSPCQREVRQIRWVDGPELVRLMGDCPTRIEMLRNAPRLLDVSKEFRVRREVGLAEFAAS